MGTLYPQVGLLGTGSGTRLILALGLASVLGTSVQATARFDERACKRVLLTDFDRGHSVVGAEALSLSDDGSLLYVAAYDRRGEADDGDPPQGGLYTVDVEELRTYEAVDVWSVADPASFDGGFRPHGLAFYEEEGGTSLLAVINRRFFGKSAFPNHYRPTIEVFEQGEAQWDHRQTVEDPSLCRANDLAFRDRQTLLVTIDRSTCADFTFSEDVMGFPGGSVIEVALDVEDPDQAVDRLDVPLLNFPNGIAIDHRRDRAHIATTKDAAIQTFSLSDLVEGKVARPLATIPLPGHPDNIALNANEEGGLIAPIFGNLLELAAYRFTWFGTQEAASWIVSAKENGEPETLFRDADGTTFSAASAAVLGDLLIAGSVGDEGLLVCGTGVHR
ncbi:MAG: hypothetical protein AAGF59_06790 [Pseudomonadota bacterium]